MNNLSAFMLSFCSSCILLGFLYMLCPKNKLSNSVKYVFCLCFLCCILSGVVNFPKLNIEQFETNSNNTILTEQYAAVTAQNVFSQALIDKGINFSKILVSTTKLSNGSITINKVTVYSTENSDLIKQIIGSNSYEVYVINE